MKSLLLLVFLLMSCRAEYQYVGQFGDVHVVDIDDRRLFVDAEEMQDIRDNMEELERVSKYDSTGVEIMPEYDILSNFSVGECFGRSDDRTEKSFTVMKFVGYENGKVYASVYSDYGMVEPKVFNIKEIDRNKLIHADCPKITKPKFAAGDCIYSNKMRKLLKITKIKKGKLWKTVWYYNYLIIDTPGKNDNKYSNSTTSVYSIERFQRFFKVDCPK